jgi:hypothetical protein
MLDPAASGDGGTQQEFFFAGESIFNLCMGN